MKANTPILLAALVALALTAVYFVAQNQRLEKENAELQKRVALLSLEKITLAGAADILNTRLHHHISRQAALYDELAEIKHLPRYVWTPDDLGP